MITRKIKIAVDQVEYLEIRLRLCGLLALPAGRGLEISISPFLFLSAGTSIIRQISAPLRRIPLLL